MLPDVVKNENVILNGQYNMSYNPKVERPSWS